MTLKLFSMDWWVKRWSVLLTGVLLHQVLTKHRTSQIPQITAIFHNVIRKDRLHLTLIHPGQFCWGIVRFPRSCVRELGCLVICGYPMIIVQAVDTVCSQAQNSIFSVCPKTQRSVTLTFLFSTIKTIIKNMHFIIKKYIYFGQYFCPKYISPICLGWFNLVQQLEADSATSTDVTWQGKVYHCILSIISTQALGEFLPCVSTTKATSV